MVIKIKIILLLFFVFIYINVIAQNDSAVYFKGAIKENRVKQYHHIVNNIINKNLSLVLTDSTEENWEDAFWALEVLQYNSPWVNNRIHTAFDSTEERTVSFQQALLDLAYTNYSKEFNSNISVLLNKTKDAKTFALCAEYLLQNDSSQKPFLIHAAQSFNKSDLLTQSDSSIICLLQLRLQEQNKMAIQLILPELLSDKFLSNNTVVFSFQRKNRDYAGITIVRDPAGNFIKNNDSTIFSVPQLARSITNLPAYLTYGNTPQGIFKMNGFDSSTAEYIGPTRDIQLRMPFEISVGDFLKDSTIKDATWTKDLYENLLPADCKNYLPLYETYYAGMAGRTEIIAHGSTIDPGYYIEKPYYPNIPSEGCLSANETWRDTDGRRLQSDQQKLIDAIKRAGNSNGYYVVIEIDDQQKLVSIEEILPFIK